MRVRHLAAPLEDQPLERGHAGVHAPAALGEGLVAGVELVRDKASHAPFEAALGIGAFCNQRAEEHGLIVRAIGDTISFCPPLIISRDEIEEMIARFRLALDDTWQRVRGEGLAAAE